MDYFRKTKDRLMQSVGLQAIIPEDPELAQGQQRLKLLYTTVQSQRTSMIQYARSMCMVGEAARKLSDDVSRFYSKSQAHHQSVGAFNDASLDQESNALFLFKEQFSDDIEQHFDHWLFEIKDLNDQCKHLAETHQNIGNLKQKIEAGQKNPSSYHSDQQGMGHDGLKHDMQVCVTEEKAFMKNKAISIQAVNQMLVQRYERFDVVFIRLMEFQKDFFADGLEVTEKYTPIVQQYREKNKIAAAAPAPVAKAQHQHHHHQQQATPAPSPAQPSPVSTARPTPASSPPQQAQARAEQPAPVQPKPQPAPQPVPQQPKEVNLFDLDFGSSPKPSAPSNNANGGVFDILGGSTSSSPTPSTQQKAQPQGAQTQDLFGDIFSSSPSPQQPKPQQQQQQPQQQQPPKQQQPSSLEDFFAGPSSTASKAPSPSTGGGSGDGFDSFLASNRTAGSLGVDDIDDDRSSKPAAKNNKSDDLLGGFNFGASSSSSSSKGGDFDFDPLGPATSKPTASKPAYNPEPEQPEGPQISESEERQRIIDHKLTLERAIEQWRFRHGVERDIQGLLSTLQTVLWTGHTWKKVDTTALLDYNSTKKVFRRAILVVHPDKVSTGTPEMKATAESVFEILNNAFKRYEVAQGLRSA